MFLLHFIDGVIKLSRNVVSGKNLKSCNWNQRIYHEPENVLIIVFSKSLVKNLETGKL